MARWRPHPERPMYWVNEYGEVVSTRDGPWGDKEQDWCPDGRTLQPSSCNTGTRRIHVSRPSSMKPRDVSVQRFLWEAFGKGDVPEGMGVYLKKGKEMHIDNLELRPWSFHGRGT